VAPLILGLVGRVALDDTPRASGAESTKQCQPRALCLVPSRALATYAWDATRALTHGTALRCACACGGVSIDASAADCVAGVDVLIATPGRLQDLLDKGAVSLSEVHFLALVGADALFDLGFEAQLRRVVLDEVPSPLVRQTMLSCSLLSLQAARLSSPLPTLVSAALQELLSRGLVSPALEATQSTQESILPTTVLQTSKLGRAVVSGNIDLGLAERLYRDLKEARPGLAVDTSLHLLFLVTPYDQAEQISYQPAVFHDIYMELGAAELAVCRGLGVTEVVIVRLMCGGSVAKAVRPVLSRLYCALMLQTLWQTG
jgi:hypothetical protein